MHLRNFEMIVGDRVGLRGGPPCGKLLEMASGNICIAE